MKVLVQPLKLSLLAIATAVFSSRSVRTWKSSSAPRLSRLPVAQLVQAEELDAAVAGDGPGELAFVGGFDEFVDELRREDVADPVPGLCCGGPEADEQVALAGAAVSDQTQGLAFADPSAAGQGVDGRGVDRGVRSDSWNSVSTT